MKKDVIYIDVEDDITSIIGKLKASSSKIVALVPPKRASVLSSVVNLKLLKKAAGDKGKQLVLVSADPALRSLAGGLEMYMAKNLTTAPEIPTPESRPEMPSDTIRPRSATAKGSDADSDASDSSATDKKAGSSKKALLAPIMKKKLPNFNSFRKRLILGGLLFVLLLVGWWYAFFIMPKATITLRGQTTNVRAEFDLNLATNETEPNNEERILPAKTVSSEHSSSTQVVATGEKNKGKKAKGTLTIENCDTNDAVTFLKNSSVRASSGERFTTDEEVTVPGADFSGGSCSDPGVASVGVTARDPGDQNNLAATSYEFENLESGAYTLSGSAMSGGTNEIVKFITQPDVNKAIDSLNSDQETGVVLEEIRTQAGENVFIFDETLRSEVGTPALDQPVGSETDATQVTITTVNTALGVNADHLNELLSELYKDQIGDQQQVVETGADNLVVSVVENEVDTAVLGVIANGKAGPNVNVEQLAQELVKVPLGEAKSITENLPGIVESSIDLTPFWASNLPRSADKITIQISEPEE